MKQWKYRITNFLYLHIMLFYAKILNSAWPMILSKIQVMGFDFILSWN